MFSFSLGTLTPNVRSSAAATSAPSLTTAGTISPASGPVGTQFTLGAPTAAGNPAPSVTLTGLTQGGVDVLAQVSGGKFTSTATGALVASWTAANGVAPNATGTASATVTAAQTAPTITTAGTISPASGPVGTQFTLGAPAASGNPAPSVTLTGLTQAGVDVLAQVSGGKFTSTATGALVASWTAANGVAPNATGTASASVDPSVSVAAFSRDRTLFDSRAAVGQNGATVPLSGTGTTGQVVQARAVSVDDAGATSTAWVDVATITGGTWTGTITVARSASWFRPEVRIKASPTVAAQGTNRFGVGHVFAIWGQSEVSNMLVPFYSASPTATIADPEAVQVFTGADTTPARAFVTTANPVTASVSAIAATLIAARPGEKFAVVFQAVAGTDPRALVNDADTSRNWANDKALHDFACADGSTVGVAAMSWFASPGSLGSAYGEALFPLFSKKTLAGAAVTIPGPVSHTGGSYQADHWFGELYDYAVTRWVAYGPHRFDITQDMADATHQPGGTVDVGMSNKQAARASWRAMRANANATMFLPMGIEPNAYLNGRDDGAGSWTDIPHPAGGTADGSPALARQTALAILRAAGLQTWTIPEFDNCLWDPAGAYVEVWSSAGAVTTTRIARGEAALPATYPHWTTVMGFQINGAPAQVTSIVGGRVRIAKAAGNFVSSDVLTFGDGGATGMVKFPQDAQNATWKNLPIVDLGLAGLNGLPVRSVPSAAVLANTLPAVTSFTTQSGQLSRFKDTVNWPTVGGKITVALDLSVTFQAATTYLFEMDNAHISLQVVTDGRIYLSIKDSGGTAILTSAILGSVASGTRFDVVVAADLAALTAWTTLNGVTTARTLAANSGVLASAGRKLCLLSRAGGTTNNVVGTIYKLEVWSDCVTGGGRPASDAALRTSGRIVGPASVANAHPWKAGGAVV